MEVGKISPLEQYAKTVIDGKKTGKSYKIVQEQFNALPKRKQDELFLKAKYNDDESLLRQLLQKFVKKRSVR